MAFVVTLLGCFGVFLLGMEFIAAYIDSAWPGLGTFLAHVVGVTAHYATFTKGVLVVGDVLYFLIWTAVFLFLNGLFLDIRSRPAARTHFSSRSRPVSGDWPDGQLAPGRAESGPF